MDDQRLNDIPDVPMKGAIPCVRCHMLVARYAPQVLASTGTYHRECFETWYSAGTASGRPCWSGANGNRHRFQVREMRRRRNAPPEPIVTRRRAQATRRRARQPAPARSAARQRATRPAAAPLGGWRAGRRPTAGSPARAAISRVSGDARPRLALCGPHQGSYFGEGCVASSCARTISCGDWRVSAARRAWRRSGSSRSPGSALAS